MLEDQGIGLSTSGATVPPSVFRPARYLGTFASGLAGNASQLSRPIRTSGKPNLRSRVGGSEEITRSS
jgi:hypothetical protein